MGREESREHVSQSSLSAVAFWLCIHKVSQILVCHSETCKQNVASLLVFITDLISLNSLLDGTERDVRMKFGGETFIPTEMIRNTLCKFMIEFSFVRTFSSNYCPIKMLGTALPGFRICKPPRLRLSERPWDP